MDTPQHRPFLPPALAIVFGILAVSTGSIFVRYAQGYAPSLVIATYRLVLATLILTPLALLRYWVEIRHLRRGEFALASLSGFFLALHFASWITSLEYTTVASSVVLVSTAPIWVALLSPLTIKEPLTRLTLFGMAMALLGSLIIGVSDTCSWSGTHLVCPSMNEVIQGRGFLGDLLALIGAWMAAGYLLIGRRLRVGMSLVPYIFVVYGAAALVLIVIMFTAGQTPWGYPPQAYVWFLLLALVPQLMGHSTFNWALGYLSAAYVSITLLGEPIGTTILAYLLLQEVPSSLKIFGAILILAGIYVASQRGANPSTVELSG